jgi:hypothetical protein
MNVIKLGDGTVRPVTHADTLRAFAPLAITLAIVIAAVWFK